MSTYVVDVVAVVVVVGEVEVVNVVVSDVVVVDEVVSLVVCVVVVGLHVEWWHGGPRGKKRKRLVRARTQGKSARGYRCTDTSVLQH